MVATAWERCVCGSEGFVSVFSIINKRKGNLAVLYIFTKMNPGENAASQELCRIGKPVEIPAFS